MAETAIPNLRRRFLSLIIDLLIIAGYALVLFGVSMFLFLVLLGGVPALNELEINLVSLVLVIPAILYCIVAECSTKKATIGKRLLKMTVASVRSGELRRWQVVVRNVIKFLPWQFAHMVIFHVLALGGEVDTLTIVLLLIANVLPIIWLCSLFGRRHRGIHDFVAGTIVVNTRA